MSEYADKSKTAGADLTDDEVANSVRMLLRTDLDHEAVCVMAHDRIMYLSGLLNTPHTADFLEAVKREAAHQRDRWGDAHDRNKSAENWYWLVGYLAGKALRSHIEGDKQKALHHTISSAAALLQWHAAIIADATGSGVGSDDDLKAIEAA